MKKLVLFLFIGINSFVFSQNIFETNWYLFELNVGGNNISIPSNTEIPYIQANFTYNTNTFETGACNFISGDVEVDELNSTITFPMGLSITLLECFISDNTPFEDAYYGFLNTTAPFGYNIIIIDGEGTYPDENILVMTKDNGDYAYFSDLQPLAVEVNNLIHSTVYPNPASDVFFIAFQNEETIGITLLDVTGKKVYEQQHYVSKNPIAISSLKKGIYFINLKTKTGTHVLKKLIIN